MPIRRYYCLLLLPLLVGPSVGRIFDQYCFAVGHSIRRRAVSRVGGAETQLQLVDDDRGDHDDSIKYNDDLKDLGRRERKRLIARREHERRRDAWLERYGSADALRRTFGTTQRRDNMSPSQTRALYHALLPRSLLALSEYGVLDPSDLAPLAYQARIAAKEYARSRSGQIGRILTAAEDWRRAFKNGSSTMTWEDIWDKYERQIMEQERRTAEGAEDGFVLDEEDLMMRIYMRILEKSCATNQAFDAIFLNNKEGGEEGDETEDEEDLAAISSRLEEDIRSILLSPEDAERVVKRRNKMEKKKTKAAEREEKRKRKAFEREEKLREKLGKRMVKLRSTANKRKEGASTKT